MFGNIGITEVEEGLQEYVGTCTIRWVASMYINHCNGARPFVPPVFVMTCSSLDLIESNASMYSSPYFY